MPRRLLSGAVLLMLWPTAAHGFLARDQIQLRVDILVNTVDGSRSACEASQDLERSWHRVLRVAIGEFEQTAGLRARAGEERGMGREQPGDRVRCLDDSNTGTLVSERPSYLVAAIAMTAWPQPKMEDERVLSVDLSISLRKIDGFKEGGEPVHRESTAERQLFFAETGDVLIPILTANDPGAIDVGIQEAFLRIAAHSVSEDVGVGHGVVSVASDLVDAELFLDAGSIGRIAAGEPLLLSNIRAGERTLSARDGKGSEIRRIVEVVASRTSLVHFGTTEPEPAAHYRLEPLGLNAEGFQTYRRGADGAVVVRIPAGEFLMGNRETERTPLEHRVHVSEFLMDETGVTWARFKRFTEATGIPLPRHEPYWGVHDEHPVVYVSWGDARAFCAWAGGRLPTEAEREKAARGTDERMYPWGDAEPTKARAVFRRSWGKTATAPVGSHPTGASPYGLQDMGGNVWEWTADWYAGDYYERSPYRDPQGPRSGDAHVVRGGSWDSRPDVLSSSCRSWGHRGYRDGDFGFRCAMNPPR